MLFLAAANFASRDHLTDVNTEIFHRALRARQQTRSHREQMPDSIAAGSPVCLVGGQTFAFDALSFESELLRMDHLRVDKQGAKFGGPQRHFLRQSATDYHIVISSDDGKLGAFRGFQEVSL
jgi:hypothetical protein